MYPCSKASVRHRGLTFLTILAKVAGMEADGAKLRKLAAKSRYLADGVGDAAARRRLMAAAAEYERRAREVDKDNATGQ